MIDLRKGKTKDKFTRFLKLGRKATPRIKKSSVKCKCEKEIVHQKQSPGGVYKKCVLKGFTKFTGKYLCQGFILLKLQAWAWLWHGCFSVDFGKYLITPPVPVSGSQLLSYRESRINAFKIDFLISKVSSILMLFFRKWPDVQQQRRQKWCSHTQNRIGKMW